MTESEICGATAKSTGEPCQRPSGWGADSEAGRCKFHGGSTPTKDENPAVGPPEGSGNAQKHALHANRGLFYNRLDEEKQAEVDKFEKALINRYQEYHGRDPDPADVKDLFEIAVGYVQRDYAREYMVEQAEESGNPLLEHVEMEKDGRTVEFDRPNSILEQIEANRKEDRMQRKDKGLEEDPESQKADAVEATVAEILSSE